MAIAVSRKTHGTVGEFDLPLSLVSTNPTTEPRIGSSVTVVMTFDSPIASAVPSVTEGTASLGTTTIAGNDVIVNLTGVADIQYLSIALSNVTSTAGGPVGSASVRIGFLAGDVNGSRIVTVADVAAVNSVIAQFVTGSNYLNDVNINGALTVADKGIVNAQVAHALPMP